MNGQRGEIVEQREWGAFGCSTDPGWMGDLAGNPLTAAQARRIDDDRSMALMRMEAGLCPACGADVAVVNGWCRCPNRGHARGARSQGPVEFRLVSVDGVPRIRYRLSHEAVGPDGRPLVHPGRHLEQSS